jgi:hypothetical protein
MTAAVAKMVITNHHTSQVLTWRCYTRLREGPSGQAPPLEARNSWMYESSSSR